MSAISSVGSLAGIGYTSLFGAFCGYPIITFIFMFDLGTVDVVLPA